MTNLPGFLQVNSLVLLLLVSQKKGRFYFCFANQCSKVCLVINLKFTFSQFRLCLVRVKVFSKNIPFSENAIFRKGKCFHVFGCISKKFLKNIFWCLEKNKEKTNPDKPRRRRRRRDLDRREIAIDEWCDRRARLLDDRTTRRLRRSSIDDRCSPIWALSLSLSLSPKMIWSENEGVKSFPGQRWKFRSTRSHFPENEIYRCYQTPGFRGKWFLEIIFPQNKRTLKQQYTYFYTLFHSHVFQKTTNNNSQTILPNTPLTSDSHSDAVFFLFAKTCGCCC